MTDSTIDRDPVGGPDLDPDALPVHLLTLAATVRLRPVVAGA